jgi:hypothetical protein
MGRRLRLEARLALGPTFWLVPLALAVLTAMHTGLGGGSGVWARHWIENSESFVPVAMGLMSAPLLLVEEEDGTWEQTGMLPVPRVAGVRLLAAVGGALGLSLVWMGVLWLWFGPTPFWAGVLAMLGPSLFLGGLATWLATRTTRVAVGYLVAVGVPVVDLVLKLLGAYQAVWPLQFLDLFVYRWATPIPAWWAVKLVMLLVGLWAYAWTIRHWRAYGANFL